MHTDIATLYCSPADCLELSMLFELHGDAAVNCNAIIAEFAETILHAILRSNRPLRLLLPFQLLMLQRSRPDVVTGTSEIFLENYTFPKS